MGLRTAQKLETRRKLVNAAYGAFAAHGIGSTNTASLAKSVGVSHGTVFVHFATRDDLLVAVMDEFGARLSARFLEVAAGRTGLKGILTAHLAVIEEFEDFYVRLVRELPQLPAQVRSLFFMLQANISHRMFEAAQVEMKRGKLKKLDRPLFFNTWLGLLHHYLAHREMFVPHGSLIAAKGDELHRHFLTLITK